MAVSSRVQEVHGAVGGAGGGDVEAPLPPASTLTRPSLASKRSRRVRELADLPAVARASSRRRLGVDREPSHAELRDADGDDILQGNAMARLNYGERQQRRRATSSLLLGTIFGGLGFFTAALLGIYRTYFASFHEVNLLGETFPSGEPYWPGSVSEMVNDPRTPQGKVWYAFETIAALAIWSSWYPWELRNVYIGGGVKLLGCCLPFLHARTLVPPIGLLMLVMIPLGSPGQIDFTTDFASWVHLTGALLMIGGHGLFELYTLACAKFVHIQPQERILRWVFCLGCLGSGVLFLVWGNLSGSANICCSDVLRVPTDADISAARSSGHLGKAIQAELAREMGQQLLYDTASGSYLTFKFLAYWCEVLAGMFMVAGLLTIWWFCPERHLDLYDELPGEYAEDGDSASVGSEGDSAEGSSQSQAA